ncbi:MAG: PKD domain-containing protein [Fluviicola sp.]|nr:PKD domain-containing protein [Fluviicola sp.]
MKLLLLTLLISATSFAQTPPTAQFTGNPLAVCLGLPVVFTNQSTQGTAAITNYAWDFGDGNSSTLQNPSHIYAAPGVYTVTLVVQASNGQADPEVKTNYITVNPTPTANFTASTNGCSLPVGVSYNNSSTGGSTYSWNFGNGQTSTLQNPATVNYTTANTYDVSLIVTNTFGCKDTLEQAIVVSNFQAGITAPATACQNTPVTISDNSTVGANSWSWTFGGGSPGNASSENNSVTFSTPGTYTISLTSQNTALGCSGNTTQQITVLPTPTPSFTANPTTGCSPLPVTFTNTSPAGSNFVWDFGDGSTFNGQNPPVHIYNGNATYTVTLSMTGTNGCQASVSVPSVTLSSPIANFSSDVQQGCAPLSVQFTESSTSPDPIVTWVWIYGDGQTFTGQTPPVHDYSVGVYDVSLVVITQNGCIDTTTLQDYIQVGEIDLVNFSIDATPQCAKTPIDFTDLSIITAPHTPNEVTYNWDFGDGGSSTLQNPTYSYPNDTGYFDVTLIVTFRGCKDTLSLTDAVYIKAPISKFTPAQTLYCNPASFPVNVVVNDDSKIGALPDDCSMIWRWGDGSITNFDDPDFDDVNLGTTSHNYTAYGTYSIRQVIFNYTTGCSDSTDQIIHISQTIAGIGALSNDSVCVNASFSLSDNSTSTHPFGTYSWNMGNGQTVSGANPSYAYPSFGTFTITLTATNSVGCADDATFTPMIALALPQAVITANDNAGCAPFQVTFSNGSSVMNNGVPLESFLFSFPDNSTTQSTTNVGTTVNHTFLTEGNFPVSLVATDEFGCVSAPATTTIVITKPVAQFTADAVVCESESFTTVNTSSGANPLTYEWFVDGTSASTNATYTNAFNEPSNGTSSTDHAYTLIVTDVNGCKDTLNQTVSVSTPLASIDYVLDGASTNANGDFLCPPVFADFTDNSLTLGNITNYNWIFGDGKISTLENPSNTYVFPGTYSVTLSIVDEFGCTSDTTLVDYLTIFGPVANPSWNQGISLCGQDVLFDIGATSNVTNIIWDLNDGNFVNDSTNFLYTYLDVTTYNPSVTVFDSNNCQVIYPMDPITIPDNGLDAFFTPSFTDVSLGQSITYVDGSTFTNPIVSWNWDLGNTPPFTNTTGSNVSSVYVTPGTIPITLIIEDALGCFDSYTTSIHVDGNFNMPNIFTPDGNGTNETFSFIYDIFKSFNITVMNRWGNVVHQATNQTGTIFWDGYTQAGQMANEGTYFYLFDAILLDGTDIKKEGFVYLMKQ